MSQAVGGAQYDPNQVAGRNRPLTTKGPISDDDDEDEDDY